MPPRLEKLKAKVDVLYQAKNPNRADWADWLYENHIFAVAEEAGNLADEFGGSKDLVMAAGMLHDIADAVMNRENPDHEKESLRIGRILLQETGFSDSEIAVIIDYAITNHSCYSNTRPKTLEGKIMATADAVVHLKSDFYNHALETKEEGETFQDIADWALPKLDRDFYNKIAFDSVREQVRLYYERLLKQFSS